MKSLSVRTSTFRLEGEGKTDKFKYFKKNIYL